jgi:hypothetical protein
VIEISKTEEKNRQPHLNLYQYHCLLHVSVLMKRHHHEKKELYWSLLKIGLETLCHYLLGTYMEKEAIVERDENTK